MPQQNIETKKKVYFLYFIGFSVIILGIFSFIIFRPFWDYVQSLKVMEKYYRGKLENTVQYIPKINRTDPIKGAADSKVTIFEYGDFICQSCRNLQSTMTALEKFYGNKIRIVFKGVPISLHPENRASLNAGYCAWEQNNFWPYQTQLYSNYETLTTTKYQQIAKDLNLNLDTFNRCLTEYKYGQIIEQNLADAVGMEITSIPTIYVNEQKVKGLPNYNSIKTLIDQELAKK